MTREFPQFYTDHLDACYACLRLSDCTAGELLRERMFEVWRNGGEAQPVKRYTINMSKQAEKRERETKQFNESSAKLERMFTAYSAGETALDGCSLSASAIADEIVSKYRARGRCLLDKDIHGVSYDGPLYADILAAMEATKNRFDR